MIELIEKIVYSQMGSNYTYGSISGSIDHVYKIGTEFRITLTRVAFEDLCKQASPFVSTVMYRDSTLCPSPPKGALNQYSPLNTFTLMICDHFHCKHLVL